MGQITTRQLIRGIKGIPWGLKITIIEAIRNGFDMTEVIGFFPEAWRVPSLFMGLAKAHEKIAFLRGEEWHTDEFSLPDSASAWQLFPSWEKEVKSILDKLHYGLFVDVGANMGFYTRRMALAGNHVIAFEASGKTYKHLQETIRQNHIEDNVWAYRLACWKEKTVLKIGGPSHAGMKRITEDGQESVQGVRLDDILDGRRPNIVKIDTEGSEPQVLEGMKETLRLKPKVIFEAWTPENLSACSFHLPNYRIRRLDNINYLAVPD